MNFLTPHVIYYDSLPSTNSEAARLALEGAAEGLCIVADEQTAGRGRLQRQWISPKRSGLYFSILLRPSVVQRQWALITMMAAVAVHDALSDAYGFHADIKWPNDILAQGQKLSGILAETIETRSGRAVVVGIGINLTSAAFPPELSPVATSLEAATGNPADREVVMNALIQALDRHYGMLHDQDGASQIVAEWCRRSSYATGKRIRVSNGDETIEGTTCGLESDGALRLETEDGEIRHFHAGDVTLLKS